MMKPKDLLRAIRKNGYKQTRFAYFKDKYGSDILRYQLSALTPAQRNQVSSACVLGQVMLNLNIGAKDLDEFFLDFQRKTNWRILLGEHIIARNDTDGWSCEQIADELEKILPKECLDVEYGR